jgi:sterol-4alpha-carboxylate 3-dehydrogenase (decarboxylating)
MATKKKKLDVLVTGGSGFLGRGVVESLLQKHPEWSISILDIQPPPPDLEKRILYFIPADITSAQSVNNAFVDYSPDLVMHSAGIVPARKDRYSTSRKQWEKVKAINYEGTRHVLDAAMASGCRKFVYTSSCTVVIDDQDHDYYNMNEDVPIGLATLHYGKSKGMAEKYVLSPKHEEEGLKTCALRPCTIIGPGDTAVISLMHDLIAKRETYFIVGDGDNFYDWMYIDNAVQAHVLAIENLLSTQTAAGHAFFISNQEPVYFWDSLAYVWAQFGHVPRYRIHIPAGLAWFAAYVNECITFFTGGASTLDRGSVKDGIRTHYSDNDKAQRILGYVPKVGLAEGMRLACEDYKKHLAAGMSLKGELKKTQ